MLRPEVLLESWIEFPQIVEQTNEVSQVPRTKGRGKISGDLGNIEEVFRERLPLSGSTRGMSIIFELIHRALPPFHDTL